MWKQKPSSVQDIKRLVGKFDCWMPTVSVLSRRSVPWFTDDVTRNDTSKNFEQTFPEYDKLHLYPLAQFLSSNANIRKSQHSIYENFKKSWEICANLDSENSLLYGLRSDCYLTANSIAFNRYGMWRNLRFVARFLPVAGARQSSAFPNLCRTSPCVQSQKFNDILGFDLGRWRCNLQNRGWRTCINTPLSCPTIELANCDIVTCGCVLG